MSPTDGGEEVVADAVDEHALADRQRRLHRPARDPVGLDDERLDAEGERERQRDDQDELDDLIAASEPPEAHAGSSEAGRAVRRRALRRSMPSTGRLRAVVLGRPSRLVGCRLRLPAPRPRRLAAVRDHLVGRRLPPWPRSRRRLGLRSPPRRPPPLERVLGRRRASAAAAAACSRPGSTTSSGPT